MDSLNQIELQNIRHICGHSTNFCTKINYYKTLTQDENVITVFDDICQVLENTKTELANLL